MTAANANERLIEPARRIRGAVRCPGDKSISHRALILGALARGRTAIRGLAPGLDVQSTRRCLEALGVKIEAVTATVEDETGEPATGELLLVDGRGFGGLRAPPGPLDCGNSGTTTRLLAGVLAACEMDVVLAGDASLSRRPMGRVAEPLRLMGAVIEPAMGASASAGAKLTAPFRVRGTGRPRAMDHELSIASAQVKSAILLAGLRAEGRTTVREPSRSRDHSERMLRVFGVDVLEDGLAVSIEGPADLDRAAIEVPADFSSAAFFLAAAAGLPGSRVLCRGVGVNPGRTGILEILADMGAKVLRGEEREQGFEPVTEVVVEGPAALRPARISGALVPRSIDELVVLSVLAARAGGTTEIRDAAELRVKESDRIALVAKNLEAMGGRCEPLPDGIRIHGPTPLRGGAAIETGGDHRIAMAFAVAALFVDGGGATRILDAGCADVSYPGFYEALESVCER
jgi:3-phosphoshikimate 1-carboxyvinyltransferase